MAILLVSCAEMKDPQFRRLENFGVRGIGIKEVDIGFTVTYFNPNSFGLSVKEAVADFFVDSIYMGKFTQSKQIDVAKNSEFSVPFTGSVPLAEALKLKVNDLSNRELSVKADGSVRVGKAGVFISRPFTYSGKHKLDLKL
ncbi:MAG TPA: LEA type 2 family protein [Chitinophagaceae bacterium]|nr:LEA type 2 family protein [Chitinophagaceae bacterium]